MAKLVRKGIACFGKSSKGKSPGELVVLSKKADTANGSLINVA